MPIVTDGPDLRRLSDIRQLPDIRELLRAAANDSDAPAWDSVRVVMRRLRRRRQRRRQFVLVSASGCLCTVGAFLAGSAIGVANVDVHRPVVRPVVGTCAATVAPAIATDRPPP